MELRRWIFIFFFFQAEDGIRDIGVTGVQTCALPIFRLRRFRQTLCLHRLCSAISRRTRGGRRRGPRRARGARSEERRVGEESRSRGLPYHLKKKKKIVLVTLMVSVQIYVVTSLVYIA